MTPCPTRWCDCHGQGGNPEKSMSTPYREPAPVPEATRPALLLPAAKAAGFGAGTAVVLLLAALGWRWWMRDPGDPDQPARRYLQALYPDATTRVTCRWAGVSDHYDARCEATINGRRVELGCDRPGPHASCEQTSQ